MEAGKQRNSRKKERLFLLVTAVVMSFLFISLYMVLQRDFKDVQQRLEEGTYGTCVDCGQPIPDARLEVRPEATRCVADQEKYEAANA